METAAKTGGRYIIACDLEGVACVVGTPGTTLNDSGQWEFARQQAVREINAAAGALFDMGADDVLVWDNHGSGVNLPYEKLDARVHIAMGGGWQGRWPGVSGDVRGVLLIGYHARDNHEGVLNHSYTSVGYQYIRIRQAGGPWREVGEIGLDAACLGEAGVPVILVASDSGGLEDAGQWIPQAECVMTKQALARNGAISLHPQAAALRIAQGTRRAVERLNRGEIAPLRLQGPLEMEIRYKRQEGAAAAHIDYQGRPWDKIDAYTRRGRLGSVEDYFTLG
nr:M55 family metallopeptidase [bacterium]